jgi:outer membrane protein
MTTKIKFLLAPALALMLSAGLSAQATKVALINMQMAIANTKDGKAQIAELEKKYGPKQQEFQKRASDIQTKQDQLNKTRNTISDEARAALEADINRMKTTLQRDTDDTQADSEADEQKLVQDIYGKIVQVVTKLSQDKQIMLVFDVSSQPNNLVCCGSAPDITEEVVALYDKTNFSAGSAPAPAPGATTPKPSVQGVPRSTAPVNTPARPAGAAPTK